MSVESYIMLLLAVFSASLSHCVGMCGGIVLGLNMRDVDSKMLKIIANVIYFCGRSVSYVCVGLLFSIISLQIGFVNSTLHGVILIVLGVLLFSFAFCMVFFPRFLNFSVNSNVLSWYKRVFVAVMGSSVKSEKSVAGVAGAGMINTSIKPRSNGLLGFFLIGMLNGFLPCHLVYMFALKAASSADLWESVCVMLVFCVGTFLPLFLVGVFSGSLLNSKARSLFLKLSFIIMTYFAFSSIYNGVSKITDTQSLQEHSHMHKQDEHTEHVHDHNH